MNLVNQNVHMYIYQLLKDFKEMKKAPVMEIMYDFIKGKHTMGQIKNLVRYFIQEKNTTVSWHPIHISTFITYRCNLSCDICLTHSRKFNNPYGQKPTDDMSFELFKNILNFYNDSLIVNIIGNGEPLLHKDFFKMIEYAANVMKMNVNSSSNGILVGKYTKKIIDSSLKNFNISINGHNHKEFNRLTGMQPELFDIITDNTAKLMKEKNNKRSKLNVAASFILDQENIKYLENMIYFANNLNVDKIIFFQYLPVPAKGYTAEERCLFSDNIEVLKSYNMLNSLPQKIKNKVIMPPLLEPLLERRINNKNCETPFYNLSIDGDGNIGGCSCQLLDLSRNGKFTNKDVWNSPYFRELRRRFIDPELELLEPCTWCYNNSGKKTAGFQS